MYVRVSTNKKYSRIFANIRESYSFVIRQNWRNIREYIYEYSRIFPNIREYSRNCLSIISSFCSSKWRKMRWRKMMEENDNLCIWIKQFLFFLFTCYMYMSWQLNEYIHWNSDVSCRKSKKNLPSKISGKKFPEFVLSIFYDICLLYWIWDDKTAKNFEAVNQN